MRLLSTFTLALIAALPAHLEAQPSKVRDQGKQMGRGVPTDRDTILRVQILLDQNLFCPGKLDGALGEFSYKAVVNYNFAHGRRDLYDWSAVVEEATNDVPSAYARHRIREELFAFINPDLPEEPELWQSFKAMSYRSMVELVAERFHTDETFLAKINPGRDLNYLRPGDVINVPNIAPFKIEEVKKYQGFKEDPILSKHIVVIDTVERMGAIYDENERMLAAFPITPGKPQFIPRGQWKIVNMNATPEFRYDKKFLEEGQRGETAYHIPPGPNSPVGILWAGLSKSGIGLHGTAFPRTIGRAQSAGCVRFANWDAIRLPSLVRPGSPVIVR
ncbi:MAG: L,D-transpeptidase [Verrucomicrobiaceae bacterium]|nr:L,D-transpeptidase [Verrucomicrobiaceae bacterium]